MAAAVTLATSAAQPARSASRSITSSWMRVESTSMTISRSARRCSPPRWTATSMPCSTAARARSSRSMAGSPAGHVQLDAGHRLLRQPADAVDVGPAGRDPPGDGGDGGGRQRAAQQGDVQPPAPDRVRRRRRAHGDLGLQAELGGQRVDRGMDVVQVRRRVAAEQHPEHQPAPDHHLLDVEHGQRVPGQGAEQPGGHARPVPAGQRDEQRGPRSFHRGRQATRKGRHPQGSSR